MEGTKSTFVLSTAVVEAVVECLLVSCKLGGVCIPHTRSPGRVIPAPITCTAGGIPAPARGATYWRPIYFPLAPGRPRVSCCNRLLHSGRDCTRTRLFPFSAKRWLPLQGRPWLPLLTHHSSEQVEKDR